MSLHILWLTPYTPWPLDSGGRIRLHHLVKAALARGATVDMCVLGDRRPELPVGLQGGLRIRVLPGRTAQGLRPRLASLRCPLPTSAWLTNSPAFVAELATLRTEEGIDVAILEQSTVGGVVEELDRVGIPWILDAQNIESEVYFQMRRRGTLLRNRLLVTVDGVKMQRLEAFLHRAARLVVAMSDIDASKIRSGYGSAQVITHGNGVDLDYFHWVDHSTVLGPTVAMSASFSYGPNADAARWIIAEILPELRRRLPGMKLILVGRDPPPDVCERGERDLLVTVTGRVADVRPYLRAADVFLVPFRAGGGTRLKVLEALASGLPVVGTPLAVQGLGVEGANLVSTGRTAFSMANAVERLIQDEGLRRWRSIAGRRFVEDNYSWPVLANAFMDSVSDLVLQERDVT